MDAWMAEAGALSRHEERLARRRAAAAAAEAKAEATSAEAATAAAAEFEAGAAARRRAEEAVERAQVSSRALSRVRPAAGRGSGRGRQPLLRAPSQLLCLFQLCLAARLAVGFPV